MKKKSRAGSERTQRRAAARSAGKLADDRERLFRLNRGGSAERPIPVSSASVVEAHAKQLPCPQCAGAQRVVEHHARSVGALRLREVELLCNQCGTRRSVFFHIEPALPN